MSYACVISRAVSLLRSLISLDNSLEVYEDRSLISYDVKDWTVEISIEVSLERSLISVLSVLKVNEERSLISLDNSLDV